MKSTLKKVLSIMLALLTISGVMPIGIVAHAYPTVPNEYDNIAWPDVSTIKYCRFIAEYTMPVYTSSSLTTRGASNPYNAYPTASIDKNDNCYIYRIGDGYALVEYPVGNVRKQGYIYLKGNSTNKGLFYNEGITSPTKTFNAPTGTKVYTYLTWDEACGTATYGTLGYIESGDAVYR